MLARHFPLFRVPEPDVAIVVMALQSPSDPGSGSPIDHNVKRPYVPSISVPIAAVLPSNVYSNSLGTQKLREKKQKAKEITSVGSSTAFARTLIMQGLWLFYRTPIKVVSNRAY